MARPSHCLAFCLALLPAVAAAQDYSEDYSAQGAGEDRSPERPQGRPRSRDRSPSRPPQRPEGFQPPHEVVETLLRRADVLRGESAPAFKGLEELHRDLAAGTPAEALQPRRAELVEALTTVRRQVDAVLLRIDSNLRIMQSGPKPPADAPDFTAMRADIAAFSETLTSALERDARAFSAPAPEPGPAARAAPAAAPRAPPSSPLPRVLLGVLVAGGLAALFLTLLQRMVRTTVMDATRAAALAGGTPPPLSPEAGTLPLPQAPPPAAAAPAPAEATEEGPGTVIGGAFRILQTLGQGGMGVVYLAEDLALGRRVAVKRMRDEIVGTKKGLDGFLTEARLVAGLKHPNIVEIYQILQTPGRVYLVFEHVEGQDLMSVLDRVDRLAARDCGHVLGQVAGALDYAHSRRIIHRDLKPANVMVSSNGFAKVMDFGVAHEASQTLARVTQADVSGTLPYMAPEQEMGAVSRASDVFALGVCLYEMLTGKLPFKGPNFLAQKMEALPEPPSRLAPGLPAGVDAVVARALAPDASKRFASAGELAAAFRSIL